MVTDGDGDYRHFFDDALADHHLTDHQLARPDRQPFLGQRNHQPVLRPRPGALGRGRAEVVAREPRVDNVLLDAIAGNDRDGLPRSPELGAVETRDPAECHPVTAHDRQSRDDLLVARRSAHASVTPADRCPVFSGPAPCSSPRGPLRAGAPRSRRPRSSCADSAGRARHPRTRAPRSARRGRR